MFKSQQRLSEVEEEEDDEQKKRERNCVSQRISLRKFPESALFKLSAFTLIYAFYLKWYILHGWANGKPNISPVVEMTLERKCVCLQFEFETPGVEA